jgi:hypothetical protein
LKLQLTIGDVDHLLKFRKFLGSAHKIREIKNHVYVTKDGKRYPTKDMAYISIGSIKICNDLIKLGCIPNKSLTLKFPNEEQVPKDFLIHFIRGYFDGDGCICKHIRKNRNNYAEYMCSILGTSEFLTEVRRHIGRYGMTVPEIKKYKNQNISMMHKCGNYEVINLGKILYKNSSIFLERKRNLFLECLDYVNNKIRNKTTKYGGLEEIKWMD